MPHFNDKDKWVKQMKKIVISAVLAGLLCWVPMVSAQTKIRAEGMAVISNYKIISEKRQGDQFEVAMEAEVGRERLKDRLEAVNLIITRKAKPRQAINDVLLLHKCDMDDANVEGWMKRGASET